jgi:hypothetical protein
MLLNGRPKKLLLAGQILAAQEISKSEAQAAQRLGVSFMTYRKYAKMYGIYGRVKNKAGIGIDKSIKNEDTGKYPLNKILEGKFPDYSSNRLKERLLRSRRIEAKCNRCDFSGNRKCDAQHPILLNYIDNNDKNKKRENIELLCYNCYFIYVNNPFGCRKKFKHPDGSVKEFPPITEGDRNEIPVDFSMIDIDLSADDIAEIQSNE